MFTGDPTKLRVGIAGLGYGAAVHYPAFRAMPDVEVVAIAGRNPERVASVAGQLGVSGCCSVEELLSHRLDIVTLALPPDQVDKAATLALNAGVSVLCEKPLGVGGSAAAALANAAAGKTTAVDFIFGELSVFQALKKIVDEKRYGKVKHVSLSWLTESWANRNRVWSWKTDATQGGGVISILGSHVFYLAEWLFGPIQSLSGKVGRPLAQAFAPSDAVAAEDLLLCQFHYPSGIMLDAVIGNAIAGVTLHRWVVVLEDATIEVINETADYVAGFKLRVYQNGALTEEVGEGVSTEDGRLGAFSKLAQRFVDAVRTEKAVYPDFAVGARVQHIDHAIRESIQRKQVVIL